MTTLSRGVIAMSAANAAALATAVGSYFVYSKLLTPADFGIYAGALTVAKLGTTLLDGGLKTSLIKHPEEATAGVKRGLFLGSCAAAVAAVSVLSAVLYAVVSLDVMTADTAIFFVAYAAAYFISYPVLFIPLAQLEREQRFAPVARSEALSVTIEYGLPALLWILVAPGFWSFVAGAWLGRTLRSALVLAAADDRGWLMRGKPDWSGMLPLFREGIILQSAVSISMARDSLHLIVVGPWFGKEWAGIYAWALQLCGVASQVFVQTATRVSLPALRITKGSEARWRATLFQIAWLALLTTPALVFLPELAAAANREVFDSKWRDALPLLPLLLLRMLPGMATTPLGSLLLAERGAREYARANAVWSFSEFVAAIAFAAWLGPVGLAWSYSVMAWVGVASYIRHLPAPASFNAVLRPLLVRRSLWSAVVMMLGLVYVKHLFDVQLSLAQSLMLSGCGALACVATERTFRGWIAARYNGRSSPT